MLTFPVFIDRHPFRLVFPYPSAPTHPSQWPYLQTNENMPSVFNCLRTLLFYVGLKSFVCHSYEKDGGVPTFFPFGNRASDKHANPADLPLAPRAEPYDEQTLLASGMSAGEKV